MSPEPRQERRTTGLKIISVVLAVLLWFYVVNQGENPARQNVVEVNLQYYNLAEGLTYEGPETVMVKLWGALGEPGEIIAFVDLEGLKKGVYEIPVRVEPVKGAMFTTVEPDKVSINIKHIAEHSVKVDYEIIGNPAPGYELLDIAISPKSCLVKGEEKAVNRVAKVVCKVNLNEQNDTGMFKLPVEAFDAEGNRITEGIRLLPGKVTVHTIIDAKTSSVKVKVTPAFTGNLGDGYEMVSADIVPAEVTIVGKQGLVEKIKQINTAVINLAEKTGTFTGEIDLEIPEGIKVYPSKVLVNIEIKKTENEVEE